MTTLAQTPSDERNADVSPDGRWLAYEANDSGPFNVHVRPFPNVSSGYWQVSTDGGTRPLWARNSQELFYLNGHRCPHARRRGAWADLRGDRAD